MDRPTRIGVASLVFVAMMFMFVFPTRSYLAQQRQVGTRATRSQVLRAQNEKLAREAKRLKTPSEIERLARSQFNMVIPGEQAYNVVAARSGSATTTTTDALNPDRAAPRAGSLGRVPATDSDVAALTVLLGREPRGEFDVVVRDAAGRTGGDPQRAAARRRHADADPLLAGRPRRS